jgi:GT2 family glycosyltransferase
MEPGVNLGYFGGADYALSRHLAEEPLPEWVVLSNPDVRIPAPDFFEQVLDLYADRPPGIVAPAIRSVLSRTDQNPYLRRRPSRMRMHFYKWLFRFRLAARGYQRTSLVKLRLLRAVARLKDPAKQGVAPEAIYAPHGSFMLFHRSYFEAGGTLRHGTFLFGEEIFVAETARLLGLAVIHDPRLVVEHEQGTPSKILGDPDLQTYAKDAAAFVAREYF